MNFFVKDASRFSSKVYYVKNTKRCLLPNGQARNYFISMYIRLRNANNIVKMNEIVSKIETEIIKLCCKQAKY